MRFREFAVCFEFERYKFEPEDGSDATPPESCGDKATFTRASGLSGTKTLTHKSGGAGKLHSHNREFDGMMLVAKSEG